MRLGNASVSDFVSIALRRKTVVINQLKGTAMTTHMQRRILAALSCTFIWCTAQAQDADDYRGALAMAKRDGCTTASIPYPDLRDAAERKQADVTRWCKEAPRSCVGIETKRLVQSIEGIPKGIENLTKDRDSLRDKRSSAPDSERSSIDSKIGDLERKIDERKKELDFAKGSLNTDRSDAEKRIYNGKYCVQARGDVQPPFRSASSRARDAGSTVPAVKAFTDELRNIWDQCERDHEKDIKTAKEAVEYCEKAKSGDI